MASESQSSGKPRTGAAVQPGAKGQADAGGLGGATTVNKDYCFRHAQMYEGWECPLCAREKAQAADRSQLGLPPLAPGHGGSAGAAGSEAPGLGARSSPPASRSASRARSEEASHLLDAGALRDALNAVDKALDLDRSNLHAYVVGARAANQAGDFGRLEEMIEEGARLLRHEEYRSASHWYHDLLRSASDAQMARPVVASFIAAGPWPAADAVAMIRALIMRGIPGEALRLLDSIPAERRSLALCAYGAQLTARAFSMSDADVDGYLARVPASERDLVLAEFRQMCEDGAFPISTLMLIRDAIRGRYRSWSTEINALNELTARNIAAARLQPLTMKPALAMAVRLGGLTLVAVIILAFAIGGGAGLVLVGAVLALVAAGGGFVYGRDAELQRRLPAVLPGLLEEASREEANRWQVVLDDQSPVFAAAAAAPEAQAEAAQAPAPAAPTTSAPAGDSTPSTGSASAETEPPKPATQGEPS